MKYSDIGHDKPDAAMVWIYNGKGRRGGIEHHRGNRGTHESYYGPTYVKHWRGRIDLETRICSVKAPEGSKDILCPDWLEKALKEAFGDEMKVVNFGLGDWEVEAPASGQGG